MSIESELAKRDRMLAEKTQRIKELEEQRWRTFDGVETAEKIAELEAENAKFDKLVAELYAEHDGWQEFIEQTRAEMYAAKEELKAVQGQLKVAINNNAQGKAAYDRKMRELDEKRERLDKLLEEPSRGFYERIESYEHELDRLKAENAVLRTKIANIKEAAR